MKYIELHDETDTFYVNVNAIGIIETTILPTRLRISSKIDVNGNGRYCRETSKEILEKIAEAEQRERSFMDDWKKEVDEQVGRLPVGKEENSYA